MRASDAFHAFFSHFAFHIQHFSYYLLFHPFRSVLFPLCLTLLSPSSCVARGVLSTFYALLLLNKRARVSGLAAGGMNTFHSQKLPHPSIFVISAIARVAV